MASSLVRWLALGLVVLALLGCKKTEEEQAIPFKLETSSETAVSARDLFERARTLQNPEDKLGLYRRIVNEFPDSDLADASQFMVGFVYAEELGDTATAVQELRALEEKWPESDWCDDAAALIEDLEG
jgi:hypothetical protein